MSLKDKIQKEIIKILSIKKCKKIITLSPKSFKCGKNAVVDEYVRELKISTKNKDVYNIALSGNYGTGKSSILESFKIQQPFWKRNKVLTISIGDYLGRQINDEQAESNKDEKSVPNKEPGSNNVNPPEDTSLENDGNINEKESFIVDQIEKSIVKQIIFLNTENEMPESRIRRIKSRKGIMKIICFIQLLFFILYNFANAKIIVFLSDFVCHINNMFNFNILNLVELPMSYYNYIVLFWYVFSIFSIIYLFMVLKNVIAVSKIKLKYKDAEIDITTNDDYSVSKQLFEIVYFFTKNKYEVIVFEDIDRFSPDIVIKVIEDLKELNRIVNTSINSHRLFFRKKVTFIYSFRDGIFKDMKTRSKFYDYIISVLPVTSSYNSFIQLQNQIDELKNIEINSDLLSIVSRYISDFRTLKCIVNDYRIFMNITQSSCKEKIFAMAVFKNYYPQHYDGLFKKNNFIDKTIDNMKKNKEEMLDVENKKLEELLKMLKNKKLDSLKSREELKKLLLANNVYESSKRYYPEFIEVDNVRVNVSDFLNDNFDISKLNERVEVYANGRRKMDYSAFGGKDSFLKRCNKLNVDEEKIEKEISLQREKIQSMVEKSYVDFIEESDITKEDSLLKELIYAGVIDEFYIDYITAPSIMKDYDITDDRFIFNVTKKEYSLYQIINHPRTVLEKLKDNFSSPYILNIYLLEYILNNLNNEKNQILADLCQSKYEILINQFSKIDDFKYEFLCLLHDHSVDLFDKFIIDVSKVNKDIFNDCIVIANFIDDSMLLRMFSLIECSNINEVEKVDKLINGQQALKSKDFWYSESTYSNLKKNHIKVNDIASFSRDIVSKVFENNVFALNKNNIQVILNKKNINKIDLSVLEKENHQLFEIIINDFNEFGKNVYINFSDTYIQSVQVIKEILKDDKIDEMIKKEIYLRENFKINLDNDYINNLELIIKNDHIANNWSNIKKILTNPKIDDIQLLEFIINNINVISKNISKNNDLEEKYFIKLIEVLIKNKKFVEITKLVNVYKHNIKISKAPKDEDSLSSLVINNIIEFKIDNYRRIKEVCSEQILNRYLDNWEKSGENKVTYKKITKEK